MAGRDFEQREASSSRLLCYFVYTLSRTATDHQPAQDARPADADIPIPDLETLLRHVQAVVDCVTFVSRVLLFAATQCR